MSELQFQGPEALGQSYEVKADFATVIQSYEYGYDCPEVNYNYGFGFYPYYDTQLYNDIIKGLYNFSKIDSQSFIMDSSYYHLQAASTQKVVIIRI